MNTKPSAGTIARLICLVLSTLNQAVLIKTGQSFLPVESEDLEDAATNADNKIVKEIASAAADAVAMVSQTYVDGLKAAGNFDAAAQKQALSMALAACLASLSQSAQDYIERTYGDVNSYLTACPSFTRPAEQRPRLASWTLAGRGLFALYGPPSKTALRGGAVLGVVTILP